MKTEKGIDKRVCVASAFVDVMYSVRNDNTPSDKLDKLDRYIVEFNGCYWHALLLRWKIVIGKSGHL